ncbi:MAG: response regulator [Acidobacteriota bacterium]|nr:response regulator [Acidobacteriota bacterium]
MKKILVIDDDELSRALYRTVLEQRGYAVNEAESGEKGLDLYREQGADLVITDIFMEDKDGLEVIEELREMNAPTKIIAITGASTGRPGGPDYLDMALKMGAEAVLPKPIEWKEMVTTIESLLAAPPIAC